jgi:carbamate kinase
MKIVVALGGNALLRRDQALSASNQLDNIKRVAVQLARVAQKHQMVLTHGNGPQVGLLALQSASYTEVETYPLDVLGAQTEGMIGYLLEQELANLLPATSTVTTLLTRVEVDPLDPAFERPTKPIGPVYTQQQAELGVKEKNWSIAPDGKGFRRVVASPQPLRVIGLEPIRWLMAHGALVIAAGGGGIPVAASPGSRALHGVEAVIDKDLCAGLLAHALEADCLIIATDVAAVYLDWGLPSQRALGKVSPKELAKHTFTSGSMGPKVTAACRFVNETGKRAVIGSLDDIEAMLIDGPGGAGTQVYPDCE